MMDENLVPKGPIRGRFARVFVGMFAPLPHAGTYPARELRFRAGLRG